MFSKRSHKATVFSKCLSNILLKRLYPQTAFYFFKELPPEKFLGEKFVKKQPTFKCKTLKKLQEIIDSKLKTSHVFVRDICDLPNTPPCRFRSLGWCCCVLVD
ncbi:hypothetical protein ILYODFUR_005070 [Ilyodon furcidens]|uniref:Uncharacterized protein n=1 Tax=Ilyodon furcidens TaxID=33524 RepID=A0ABV0VEG1_9TELE